VGEDVLIPDWRTDRVTLVLPTAQMYVYNCDLSELELFYADFVAELARHDNVTCLVGDGGQARKLERLSGVDPGVFRVAPIPDIWMRDFAPFASGRGAIKFRYAPAHSSKKLNRAIDAAMLEHLEGEEIRVKVEDLSFEGGNLTHDGRVGVATRKVYHRNPGRSRAEILETLRRALGLERLVIVPVEPGDRTGHVDGMLRFIDEGRLLINDYAGLEDAGTFGRRLLEVLDRELPDIERIPLPYRWSTARRDGWYDARGNYANFLRTRRRVYVPVYGAPEDAAALEVFEGLFPGNVSPVDARVVARYGGSLHCISWNCATPR
jgi:agmatine deiminase